MIENAPSIPGFQLESVLGTGATSTVYRATRNGKYYAIKVIRFRSESSSQTELLRFLKEAATIARLNHPGLVKLYEVGEANGLPYLVMELIEGESLKSKIAKGPFSEAALLKLAQQLAPILDHFHCRGVIHKDIKPDNILFDASGAVKIIDFGFATDLHSLQNAGNEDSEAIGTLLYASPEQTGMLKRPADSRADLYALGGVLYHCATGKSPFESASASTLLSLHLSAKPTPPRQLNKELGPVVNAIVLKLLAKDPDDRYQSAKGLLSDLDDVASIGHRGEPYHLARHDSSLRTSEVPLIGRAEELSQLERTRSAAERGRGNILLVEGEGGSGKSRLVRELLSHRLGSRLATLSGKAKQGETIPFGPLREAIDDLLVRTQAASEGDRTRVEHALREAAGDLAGIIRRLSPGLQNLFVGASEIPPLEGPAEQERFYLKVAEFFLALPKLLGPVTLLIDDIQWLDDGSLAIIKQLSLQIEKFAFLLVATARNDKDSLKSLADFVNHTQSAELTRLQLRPLSLEAVNQLVTAHLGGRELEPQSLQAIATKANGNPFAVGEYIRALLDRGMLRPTEDKWVFDTQHFHELQLPDDVIQLLLNRLNGLSAEAVHTLAVAATIGFEFSLDLLTVACGDQKEMVQRALTEALQFNLVERTQINFAFIHDRVCEAVLKRIEPESRRELHQRLADILELRQSTQSSQLSLDPYALARHYQLGYPESNLEKAYRAYLAAGTHALENFSNEEAYEHLTRALNTARQCGLHDSQLASLYETLGLACTHTGRHAESVENLNFAIAQATNDFDRARLRYILGLARATEGKHKLARDELLTALALVREPLRRWPPLAVLSIFRDWAISEFLMRTHFGYGKAIGEERRRRQLTSKITATLNMTAFLIGDPLLMLQTIMRELRNVQRLGASVETAKAHVFYCVLAGMMARKKTVQRNRQLAITMAQQFGNQEAIAYCELNSAIALEFAGDALTSYKLLEEVRPKVLRHCTAWDKSVMIGQRAYRFTSGKARETLSWIEETLPILKQTGDLSMLHTIYTMLYATHQMLGNAAEALRTRRLQAELPSEAGEAPFVETGYYTNLVHGLLLTQDFGDEIENAIRVLNERGLDTYHSRYRFAVIGFVRLEQCRRARSEIEKQKFLAELKHYVGKAGFPNSLVPLHQCLHHALKAGWYTLHGKYRRAEKLLMKGERLALSSENLWALWLIARERARIAAAENNDTAMKFEATKALRLALDNGWKPLASQICQEFSIERLSDGTADSEYDSSSTKRGIYGRLLTAERNAEVLLQVNLASSSTLDPKAQSRAILDELIATLGAERGFLFLKDNGKSKDLEVSGGRDSEKNDILELSGYSSTVVRKVAESKTPLIVSGTDQGEVLGAESIVAHNLRSIIAVPVNYRDKFLGVLYLDSTLAKGIFTESDLEIVTALANHIAIAIETARAANFEIENREMKKDLEVTAAVQSLILPKKNLFVTEQLRMASFYKAASQSGGDWWWYDLDRRRGVFSVLMGDVTGHGPGPAMISAAVSAVYQTYRIKRGPSERLPDFLQLLNTVLYELAGAQYLISMNAFELDLENGKVDYWSAGAPPLLVIREDGSGEYLSELGTWLGSSDFGIGHSSYQLAPGERLALFTDGLFEVETIGKRELGLKRLEKMLSQTRHEPVEKASNSVIAKVVALQAPGAKEDDISFVLIDYLGSANSQDVAV